MASKRPKKAKNLNNKKPKPCSNLDDLTSLIGEDLDYCFHIFNLEESLQQGKGIRHCVNFDFKIFLL